MLSLKGMSEAVASDDGKAIAFTLFAHTGEELTFQCPPDAVPEIVARLTGAVESAARRAAPSSPHRSQTLQVVGYEVGGSSEPSLVLLHLFATPHVALGFALTPQAAQEISTGLAAASAKLAPQDRSSMT